MMKTTQLPFALMLSLAALSGLSACQKKVAETTAAQARTVSVATVEPREIEGGLAASGNLVPREDTAIFSQLTGYRVSQVLVDEGTWVKAGQPLAKLDDTLLRAQLAQQTALEAQQRVAATRANAEAARVKGLDTQGVLSQEEIDTRRFSAQSAQAQVQAQQALLSDVRTRESLMVVRAPYSGLIIERTVRAGDMGGGTTPWFRMAKDGQVELLADLSEDALGKIHVGDPGGAKALGLDSVIGSVEVGKKADLVLIKNDNSPVGFPILHPYGHVVFQANRADVHTVLVNGQVVKYDHALVGVDLAKARASIASTIDYLQAEHGPEEWANGMHPEIPEHETLNNPYTYRDDVSAWKDSE